jgi:hypothetical protein
LWIHRAADDPLPYKLQEKLATHLNQCQACDRYAQRVEAIEIRLQNALKERWTDQKTPDLNQAYAHLIQRSNRKNLFTTLYPTASFIGQVSLLVILVILISWILHNLNPQPAPQPLNTPIPQTITPSTSLSITPTNPNTQPAPTETISPPVPLTNINELLGIWRGFWSDTSSIYFEFKANGTCRIFFAGEDSYGDSGVFRLDGSQITWIQSATSCVDDDPASYLVWVIKRGETPVQLYFEVVGKDTCADRLEALNGRTLVYYEP